MPATWLFWYCIGKLLFQSGLCFPFSYWLLPNVIGFDPHLHQKSMEPASLENSRHSPPVWSKAQQQSSPKTVEKSTFTYWLSSIFQVLIDVCRVNFSHFVFQSLSSTAFRRRSTWRASVCASPRTLNWDNPITHQGCKPLWKLAAFCAKLRDVVIFVSNCSAKFSRKDNRDAVSHQF